MPEHDVHTKFPTVMSTYVTPGCSHSQHCLLKVCLASSRTFLENTSCVSLCFRLAIARIKKIQTETRSETAKRFTDASDLFGPKPNSDENSGGDLCLWACRAFGVSESRCLHFFFSHCVASPERYI